MTKLNVKEFDPFTHSVTWLKNVDTYIVNCNDTSDITTCLMTIIAKRDKTMKWSTSVNSALKSARILREGSTPSLEPDAEGNEYYNTYTIADKQSLVMYAMEAAGFSNSGKFLKHLDENITCSNLSEINDRIF